MRGTLGDRKTKIPRIVDSTIRAFGVQELRRAAQYFSALEKDEVEELLETDTQKQRKPLSAAGFLDAPSGVTRGGIIANGIVRTTIINLTALRSLGAAEGERETALRRYILGLTLVAACAPVDFFLRQGCLLVRAGKLDSAKAVYRDGKREDVALGLQEVESFATDAAHAFGVGDGRKVDFDPKVAKKLLKDAGKSKEEA